MPEEEALKANSELYHFLFSGKAISHAGKTFRTRSGNEPEPRFPYLRMILEYDAPSFLSSLNEAFEDPFLNVAPERATYGSPANADDQGHGRSVNRQYIISILL